MAKSIPILVVYNDGSEELFGSVGEAAELWGCSRQGVLNLIEQCKINAGIAVRRSVIAIQNNIAYIEKIEDLNILLKRGQ